MSSDKIRANETRAGVTGSDVTGTKIGDKYHLDFLAGGAIPGNYDDIVLSYTGKNLTSVVYKLDGATIATLTLTYTGNQLDRVQVS